MSHESDCLIKGDIKGVDNVIFVKVKAAIPALVNRVAKKYSWSRARLKFMLV